MFKESSIVTEIVTTDKDRGREELTVAFHPPSRGADRVKEETRRKKMGME